jgi:hypothetical protein
MRAGFVQALAVAALLVSQGGMPVQADDDLPRLPCGTAPLPAYAEADAPPTVRSWSGKAARSFAPPPCTGWAAMEADMIVALAGSFLHDGGIEALSARIGAISAMKGVRYWSTTDKNWQLLVTDAYALDGPDASRRRDDFGAAQVVAGRTLYYAQSDNRTAGQTVYRDRVVAAEPDRLMIANENVAPLKKMLVTLFEPGEMQTVYIVERRAPGIWGFYSLTRVRMASILLPTGSDASYINRSVALFRHVAGIPTDKEPPAAR